MSNLIISKTSNDVVQKPMNIDLLRERQAATIDSEEFAEWWAGGREKLHQRRALEKLFFDDPEFAEDRVHISLLSHQELYEYTLARATKFIAKLRLWHDQQIAELAKKGVHTTPLQSFYDFRMLLGGSLGTAIFQQSFPLRLHFSMFVPTIFGQGTEAQQRLWLAKAWQTDGICGTYAQTELGHGTFVRGLETRADYDAEREEFILNTPTLTAYKWWPGGMGQTANMALVIAQLYIKGKNYGVQSFLVRIRNEQTHLPEPGVDVGEIGTKFIGNGLNNGFLGLHDVRIPRTQMLMRHAQVLPNGRFVKGAEPIMTYGTMVFGRVMLVRDASFCLLQAATIATRYSFVRRQSPIEPNQPEPQIIDHVTQQAKVFPQIAKGIFFRLVADYVWRRYQDVMKELDDGNKRNLPELHALSCCLKAVVSQQASAGVEILRKACGGQGFLASTNFGQIYGISSAACTYEGENTVMLLQTARFLCKNYVDGLKRKVLPTSVSYLRNQTRLKWSNKDLLGTLVRALEIAAAEKIRLAFESQRAYSKQNASAAIGANMAGIKLTQAATLHGSAFLARIACEELDKRRAKTTMALGVVLQQLLEIFVMELFLHSLGDLLRCHVNAAITATQVADVELRYEQTMAAFRSNAIALTDGFDFHDRVLGSTLGAYDGRVYERLMAEAKKSPLNREAVNKTFETHLKPLLQGKL